MTETTIKIIKLTASDGMVLTNDEVYGKEIYLGCNDKPENWHEISDEEYQLILEAQKQEQEQPEP